MSAGQFGAFSPEKGLPALFHSVAGPDIQICINCFVEFITGLTFIHFIVKSITAVNQRMILNHCLASGLFGSLISNTNSINKNKKNGHFIFLQ
jgi:hypothetical protein